MPTWILLADEVRARLLESVREDAPLVERAGFMLPAHRHGARPARGEPQSAAPDGAPAERGETVPAPADDPLESRRFAYEIADILDEGRAHGRYARLLLVGPSPFLGTLRAVLSEGVQMRISATLAREGGGDDLGALREHLRGYL